MLKLFLIISYQLSVILIFHKTYINAFIVAYIFKMKYNSAYDLCAISMLSMVYDCPIFLFTICNVWWICKMILYTQPCSIYQLQCRPFEPALGNENLKHESHYVSFMSHTSKLKKEHMKTLIKSFCKPEDQSNLRDKQIIW